MIVNDNYISHRATLLHYQLLKEFTPDQSIKVLKESIIKLEKAKLNQFCICKEDNKEKSKIDYICTICYKSKIIKNK